MVFGYSEIFCIRDFVRISSEVLNYVKFSLFSLYDIFIGRCGDPQQIFFVSVRGVSRYFRSSE